MIWQKCLRRIVSDVPENDINTWLKPLQVNESDTEIQIIAANSFIVNKIKSGYLKFIQLACDEISNNTITVSISVPKQSQSQNNPSTSKQLPSLKSNVDPRFLFDNFVEGMSNRNARGFSIQVAQESLTQLNPLFIYGSTGLGKTHLLHAIGNEIIKKDPDALVYYVHSEQFVNEMINVIRSKNMSSIDEFKNKYRSVTALLIDDIQFFSGKERTQEEFFHTFNALLQNKQRVIITCDKFPKEVSGLDPRLKSRLGWGLSVCIDPPDFETRVAILQEKALIQGFVLSDDVAFYIAKNIKSNVREMEGALNTLWAHANFMRVDITLNFAKEKLKEIIGVHHRHVTIENIQKHVANYYNIRQSDLVSKKRHRSIVRPRQIAMSICKELTSKSLPEIGQAFGGRDHTTVIHAVKKMEEIFIKQPEFLEDKRRLINILTD